MKGRSSLEYSPLSNRVKPTIVENPFLGGIGGVRGGCCDEEQQIIIIQNRETIRIKQRKEGVTINDTIRNFIFKGLFQLYLTF